MEHIGFEVVQHLPYSPALAPSDFSLFAAFKKQIKGIRCTCDEEMVSRAA
jgi:hypothetical protein